MLAWGGCDIITLQNMQGRKNLALTQKYVHPILTGIESEETREIMRRFLKNQPTQKVLRSQKKGRIATQIIDSRRAGVAK